MLLPKLAQHPIISLNKEAMDQLRHQNYLGCYNLLNKALVKIRSLHASENQRKLISTTYNNLGYFYSQTEKPKEAMRFFLMCLEIEQQEQSSTEKILRVSGVHTNLCALYSREDKHELALRHSLKALYMLRSLHKNQRHPAIVSKLRVAYQNSAIEYTYLGHQKDAQECQQRAAELNYVSGRRSSCAPSRNSSVYSKNSYQSKNSSMRVEAIDIVRELKNRTPAKNKIIEKKRFNIASQRAQENRAAVLLQAWVRGFLTRKRYFRMKMRRQILKAEANAVKAQKELLDLKRKARAQKYKKSLFKAPLIVVQSFCRMIPPRLRFLRRYPSVVKSKHLALK